MALGDVLGVFCLKFCGFHNNAEMRAATAIKVLMTCMEVAFHQQP